MSRLLGISVACIICTALAVATAFAGAHSDDSFAVLHVFNGNDGDSPYAGLVADKAGNLYGTTVAGGNGCPRGGCGTVFRIGPGNVETVLYTFRYGSDGAHPYGGVILDEAGNLYGTAAAGGSSKCTAGCGTVFKLAPDGTFSVLHAFKGGQHDGNSPLASLIADWAGNLYGTTSGGGAVDHTGGPGTVFKLAPDGTFNLLHVFGGQGDGQSPQAALIIDGQGNLYGTTRAGGFQGDGTVFKLAPDGTERVLHSFGAFSGDGTIPFGSLLLDAAGSLYGTTYAGGNSTSCVAGCGTVFELTPGGSEIILHAFRGGSDGSGPAANLISDGAGSFFGTTIGGGISRCGTCGTVFRLAPDGRETVLHRFDGDEGRNSFAGLIADAAGNFYGTAAYGGKGVPGHGIVFSLER